ncbi:MAG: hypothetical protein P4L66_03330 [Acetobacteraceae bacterium]|nr:hypothetical protein [Acetobacteraceae bacterium]
MPSTAELKHLTRWCTARRLYWQPARTESGAPAILLRGNGMRVAWHDMMLTEEDDGVGLRDARGALLADASEIPALLDALDSGLITRPQFPAVPWVNYAVSSSEISWNRLGVEIT